MIDSEIESNSSSESEGFDLNEDEIRLAQMRRGAHKKRNGGMDRLGV